MLFPFPRSYHATPSPCLLPLKLWKADGMSWPAEKDQVKYCKVKGYPDRKEKVGNA